MKYKFNRKLSIFFFLFPSMLGFFLFYIIPFLGCGWYSLLDRCIDGSFVGLKNYIILLSNDLFQMATANTVYFALLAVPLTMLLGLLLAILINKNIKGRNIFRSTFIAPMVIPTASVVLIWNILFHNNGPLNGFLTCWGISPIGWLSSNKARLVMVLLYAWKNIGYCMVMFLGGLLKIPKEYYELADIEGAGALKKFIFITIPYLTPISFFVFVLSIINSFRIFREVYLLAGPYPHESIYTMQHYMNNVFTSLDYQKLSAAAYLIAIALGFLIYLLFKFQNRFSRYL